MLNIQESGNMDYVYEKKTEHFFYHCIELTK